MRRIAFVNFVKMQKLLLLAICVWASHGARLPSATAPVHGQVHGPVHQHVDSNVPVTTKPVEIVHQEIEVNPDGSFHNVWQSENGISVQEEGSIKVLAKNAVAQTVTGQVSYTDNDGNPFVLTYTADETGFHPQGDHLPTTPPVPAAILRSLEYNVAHPYVEPTDQPGAGYNPVVEVN